MSITDPMNSCSDTLAELPLARFVPGKLPHILAVAHDYRMMGHLKSVTLMKSNVEISFLKCKLG